MIPEDYVEPFTYPVEPYFSKWAYRIILDLDLHPDLSSEAGESQAELILRDLWNAEKPIDNQIYKVIFRPRPIWESNCSKCNQKTILDNSRPFYCERCAQELEDFGKMANSRAVEKVAEKAQEAKDRKKAAATRRKAEKAAGTLSKGSGAILPGVKIVLRKHGLISDAGDTYAAGA